MPVSHSQNVVNLFFLRNEISSEELLLKTNNNHLKVTRLIGILCGFSYSVKKTQANNNIHVFNVHVEKSTSSGSLYQKMWDVPHLAVTSSQNVTVKRPFVSYLLFKNTFRLYCNSFFLMREHHNPHQKLKNVIHNLLSDTGVFCRHALILAKSRY